MKIIEDKELTKRLGKGAPVDAVPVGSIKFSSDKNPTIAVFRLPNGRYIQVWNGEVMRIDGRSVRGALGLCGKKPAIGVKDMRRVGVHLSDAHIDKCKQAGGGDMTAGVRLAIDKLDIPKDIK